MDTDKAAQVESIDSSIWDNIRKKGVLLFTIAIYGMAIGGAIVIAGYVFFVLCQFIEFIDRFRKALGIPVHESGPDWIVLGLIILLICATLTIFITLFRWYNGVWEKRLREVWPTREERIKYSRMHDRKNSNGYSQAQYVRELLKSPIWRNQREDVCRSIPESYPRIKVSQPDVLSDAECRAAAAGIAAIVRKRIAQRALAVALVTGFSRKRWVDQLAICIAGFEIQLEVLGMLGKRPTLKYWRIMFKRTLASIFINSYFNQNQVSELTLTIKGVAMGLAAAIEAADEMVDASDAPVEEVFDSLRSLLGNSGGGPFLGDFLAVLEKGAAISLIGLDLALSAGASASRTLAGIIEKIGDDVLEASLAGGVLYYHGIELLRETLPVDDEQSDSSEFNPSPYDCAVEIAKSGGIALLDLVRKRRRQFVERRNGAAKALVAKTPIVGKIFENKPN